MPDAEGLRDGDEEPDAVDSESRRPTLMVKRSPLHLPGRVDDVLTRDQLRRSKARSTNGMNGKPENSTMLPNLSRHAVLSRSHPAIRSQVALASISNGASS